MSKNAWLLFAFLLIVSIISIPLVFAFSLGGEAPLIIIRGAEDFNDLRDVNTEGAVDESIIEWDDVTASWIIGTDATGNGTLTDTNADTACSGASTFLSGEAGCEDLNNWYAKVGAAADVNQTDINVNNFWAEGAIITGNVIPSTTEIYDLGESGALWRDLWIYDNIMMGNMIFGASASDWSVAIGNEGADTGQEGGIYVTVQNTGTGDALGLTFEASSYGGDVYGIQGISYDESGQSAANVWGGWFAVAKNLAGSTITALEAAEYYGDYPTDRGLFINAGSGEGFVKGIEFDGNIVECGIDMGDHNIVNVSDMNGSGDINFNSAQFAANISCSALETDATGAVICGTDEGGDVNGTDLNVTYLNSEGDINSGNIGITGSYFGDGSQLTGISSDVNGEDLNLHAIWLDDNINAYDGQDLYIKLGGTGSAADLWITDSAGTAKHWFRSDGIIASSQLYLGYPSVDTYLYRGTANQIMTLDSFRSTATVLGSNMNPQSYSGNSSNALLYGKIEYQVIVIYMLNVSIQMEIFHGKKEVPSHLEIFTYCLSAYLSCH